MTATVTTDRKTQFADQFGIAPENVRGVKYNLDQLRKEGLLVDLNVSGIGMFIKTASYAEMGWSENGEDERRSKLTRGSKFLIPEEQVKRLRSIEVRMRQLLKDCSYDVTGFRPYRWVPVNAYWQKFRPNFEKLKVEFYQAKEEILTNLDGYQDMIAAEFASLAETSWKSITAISPDIDLRNYPALAGGYEYAIVNGKVFNRTQFIDAMVEDSLRSIPTHARIEAELVADYVPAMISVDHDEQVDELERQAAQSRRQAAQADADLAHEKARHEIKELWLEEQEREAKIDAMFAAEASHIRQQLNTIVDPYAEVYQQLSDQIVRDAQSILESIKTNGYVRGKVAEKGRGLVEIFDLLAVKDNRELRAKLIELRSAIGPDKSEGGSERSTTAVAGILEQIIDMEHQAVANLLEGPTRFSQLEI